MVSRLERSPRSSLAAGLGSDVASFGRGRERRRCRFVAGLVPLEDRRLLSMFPVTSTADDGSTGTLRWAVAGANADASPSTIVFELGTAPATIALTQGQLDLGNTSQSVAIDDGPGQGPVTISGNSQSGAFQVDPGVTASISGLTIIDGATKVSNGGGDGSINDLGTLTLSDCTIANNPLGTRAADGLYVNGTADVTDCTITGGNSYYGAGVFVFRGTADLTGCMIEDNTGAGDVQGGGVCNFATTTLVNCTISGNTATDGGGGGLYNDPTGQLKAYGCTISDNSSSNEGAGVFNRGTAYLSGCTISGNSNQDVGGGVWNGQADTMTISGCTIRGNTANVGGGLENDGTATVTDCTISQNTADDGGGVFNGANSDAAILTLNDSTISDNILSGNESGSGGAGVGNAGQANLTDSTIANNVASNAPFTEATNGGGLEDSGTATLVACTISGNTTTADGGGIYVGGTGADSLTLNNTIVAGNEAAPTGGGITPNDIVAATSGASVSGSYDLVGTGGSATLSGSSNKLGVVDPGLGPLAANGGPTETMVLVAGSPAIASGSSALEVGPGGTPLTTDQRGFPMDTPVPDIGAYQTSPPLGLSFAGLTSPSIIYGAASVALSGTLGSGSEAPPTTESVQVTLDGVTQSAVFGAGGAFSTTFDTSTLSASATPYTVTYSYAGDASFAAASTTGTLTVGQATPRLDLSAPGGTYNGSAFKANATVTGVNGPAGSSLEGVPLIVTYYAGITPTGTPLSGPPSDAGTYTVVASFAGSTDYAAIASQPVTFAIGRGAPDVALSASAASVVYGQSVTLTATVAGPGAEPGGTVTFSDGGTTLGTVALDASGQATLTTSALAVAPHSILATYSGDADEQGETSAPVAESVAKAGTEVVLSSSPTLARKKVVSVGLTAEVVPVAPGAGVPTGALVFETTVKGEGKKARSREEMLAVATLAGGEASLTLRAGQVLKKSITIAYAGDADFASSTATPPAATQQELRSLERPMVALDRRGRVPR